MRLHLLAPLSGDIRAMEDVPDPVFAASMVGPGFAIDPFAGGLTVVSPCRGVVRQAKPHGIVIEVLGDDGEVSESDDGGRGVRGAEGSERGVNGAVGSAGSESGRQAPAAIQETDAARPGTRLKQLGNDVGEPGGETAALVADAAGPGTDVAGTETHGAGVGTLNVIVHLGLDTVHLAGEGFTVLVSPGDCVSAGQPLVLWNTSVAQRAGYSLCTPVVVVGAQQGDLRLLAEGRVEAGTPFFEVQ
ncbi:MULTISPECIES: PTS glucose transporter subunit IIA [unclassified Actinobaculum]|uniref:PTS sugar transporter subunit IIA n=1 Tax=unclassified Actinobaculum TaxID=2609299 RepID=UPI000D526280|nr:MULTISPECIES: PTS glucose transporter subunit IIA [unclassified Actinobaculum]AWE42757.1 hypothetical protein DDD63_08385 [Actinobaculum sp. 313]RTE49572.1 PTS glucose transporter subunit IIA [Actinobaculum sp. 352]